MKRNNAKRADEVNELRAKFNIEKNAKNRAYAFILAAGLLQPFAAFCGMWGGMTDWHRVCVEIAKEQI